MDTIPPIVTDLDQLKVKVQKARDEDQRLLGLEEHQDHNVRLYLTGRLDAFDAVLFLLNYNSTEE